jgi:uncharacterized protein YggL (DUF469 family)
VKKRLRKKLRLGEFQELGFEVRFRLPDDFNEADLDAFWDAFIAEAIEGAGLMCGGGCGREWDVFVSRSQRQSATEEDRRAIAAWLEGHGQIADIHIGPLVDAWYSD